MLLPPARLGVVDAMVAGDMVASAQGMTDEDRVARLVVQGPIGLVHEIIVRKKAAATEEERLGEVGLGWNHEPYRVGRNGLHESTSSGKPAVYWLTLEAAML